MPAKLKPCPFCGSEEIYISQRTDIYHKPTYAVWCGGCGVRTEDYTRKQYVIRVWNRRTPDAVDSQQ